MWLLEIELNSSGRAANAQLLSIVCFLRQHPHYVSLAFLELNDVDQAGFKLKEICLPSLCRSEDNTQS